MEELRKGAVRIALSRGLNREQGANNLGVGMSILNKRFSVHRATDLLSKADTILV